MAEIKEIDVRSQPGFVIITRDSGPPVKYPLKDLITAGSLPADIDYTHVPTISTLANMLVILIRTLIERNVLDEAFIDSLGLNWDLDHLIYAVEQMGGKYHNPDLDEVED